MRRTIRPLGPYALTTSIGFLEGVVPAAYQRPSTVGHLHLAFPIDGREAVAGVCATQPGGADAAVELEAVVAAPDGGGVDDEGAASAAIDQLARIVSLDTDGRGYEEIGRKEPAIGRLQASYRGLR